MTKIRTTITINKDLLKKAKEHDISISSFLDIELRRYIAFIEGNQWHHSQNHKKSVGTKGKENKSMDLSESKLCSRRVSTRNNWEKRLF